MGYYVYFVMNGGLPLYSPVYDVTEIPDLDDYTPYKSPTSEYSYEFGGWYYDAECTSQVIAGDPITANTALYALWIETQRGGYSITFVANGGTPIPNDLTNQTAIPDPLPSISKTGLTFDAWRWGNSSTAVAVVPGEPIYADATIYAKWVADLYDITYNSNGGSAVSSNIGVTAFPSPLPTSTKAGYTFAGWWNYNLTLQYSAGQTINGSLTVYAKWLLNSFSVTYVANGGSPEPDPLTSQAALPTPLPTINKSGYVSGGWYYNSLFTSQALAGDQLVDDVILYAKFTLATYTITYNLDGGTNSVSNPATYNIETATITLLNPSKAGYTFNGWFSDAELTTEVTEIVSGTTGNIVLYASFTLSETGYSITYEENGGSPAQTDLTNQNYLPSVLPALTKTNYVFVGWYYDAEFTLPANPSDLLSANVTLYAKFLLVSTPLKGRLDVTLSDNTIVENSKRFPTGGAVYAGLIAKVDIVEGKSLVSDTEITHLEALDTQAELDIKFGAKEDIANKGVANGYAPLNASGIVDPIYVPGAYTDYVEYDTYDNLPASGVEGTLYVVIADETSGGNTSTYRWTGSVYVNVTDKLSASEAKALYESNANTNAYTDDEKTKLSGIEALAEVNIIEGVKVDDVLLTPDVDRIVNVDISGKENTANKVNAFQATPDDTHYPSEKLVKDTFDEVGSTLASTVLKNAEQDKHIATIEEAYRKSQTGELTATKSGTDIISLGKDVAPAPLQVKVEGGLIPALENLVTNGDFSDGTTGWFAGGIATITNVSGVGRLAGSNTTTTIRLSQTISMGAYVYNLKLGNIEPNFTVSNYTIQIFDGSNVQIVYNSSTKPTSISFLSTLASATMRLDIIYGKETNILTTEYVDHDNIQLFNLTASHGVTSTSGTAYDNAVADIEAMLALNGGYISTTPIHAVGMNKRVRSVGKNLLDTGVLTNETYYDDGTKVSQVDLVLSDYIAVIPSQVYTFKSGVQINSMPVVVNRYVEFDANKNFLRRRLISADNPQSYTPSADARYIRLILRTPTLTTLTPNNIVTSLSQLEPGSTATTYVPYANTDLFLQANKVGYRVPNSVADTVEYRNGKYYFVKRVQELTITSGMITSLVTTNTSYDTVAIGQTDFSPLPIAISSAFNGAFLIPNYTPYLSETVVPDNSSMIGKYVYDSDYSSYICLIFAKGTYADLAAAQAALAGTKIYYQLATPIETEILALGNAQGLAGGTVYIDDVMADSNLYTSKYDIENTAYPIKSLDRIVKINADGSQTELAVSSATIAGDGLSFTHPSLVANDIVWVAYVPNVANTFKSNTFVTYYDNPFIAVQPDGTPRRITFSVDNSGVVTVSSEAV